MNHRLSIITINYNNISGLKDTIESVVNQTFLDFEYIVIDGGSDDGSPDLLEKYKSRINYWESAGDKGIYHAQNKGILKATGEYLLFLNSGDFLSHNKVLEEVFTYKIDEEIVYGNLYFFNSEGGTHILKEYPEELTFDYFFRHTESLPHPSSLIKRSLFDRTGLYDESFRIISDWEFWLKALFLRNASYKKIPVAISVFKLDGISSKEEFRKTRGEEIDLVYKRHFSWVICYLKQADELLDKMSRNIFIRGLRKLRLIDF